MSLTPGAKLGIYEIVDALGAGGMGEVYRARDSKLGREVAIKVLPEEFTEHPEKLARFEREARLLAALNHPKIATLYGVEEFETKPFLVMELVEGETLAERIARGPIPVEEALAIALQIAEALEAAHEKGVIHRDLKPANIKVDAEGNVKVLDFGLAKAFAGDEATESELSQSPTLSRDATRAGVILGTAAYMSPEQAKGKAVDKRTDIFSFGIVLYEMLTGKKAFEGEDVPELLARIIGKEPDWAPVDSRVDRLLRRCLTKDRKNRLRDIGDARLEMREIQAAPAASSESVTRTPVLAWGISLLLAACVAGIAVWSVMRPVPSAVKRFAINLPPGDDLLSGGIEGPLVAVSPDGMNIVYAGVHEGTEQLFRRSVDDSEPTPLAGTESGRMPFFSPDGQWIGFFANDRLKKISVEGGPSVTLCEARTPFGGSWAGSDTILFSSEGRLATVSASGGTPRDTIGPVGGAWPAALPGGARALHTIRRSAEVRTAGINIVALDTGEQRSLVEDGTGARYVAGGHIVFVREGVLFAIPFDSERMEITGAARPVLDDVGWGGAGEAYFDVSDEGTLVYVAGQTKPEAGLVRVNREGEIRPLGPRQRATWYGVEFSPDDSSAVVSIEPQIEPPDLWVIDSERESLTRLTFSEVRGNRSAVWSPDGRRIFFWGGGTITSIAMDGSDRKMWIEGENSLSTVDPTSISSDQKVLIVSLSGPNGSWDIGVLRLDGSGEVETILGSDFDERRGRLSPDDRWMAYESNETGRFEIYVQPFPGPGRKVRVSTEGGTEPRWSSRGDELFYRNQDQMLVVSTMMGPDFRAGEPTLLFEGLSEAHRRLRGDRRGTTSATYDVSADGQEFVMIQSEGNPTLPQIHVVLNWHEELKRLVPAR